LLYYSAQTGSLEFRKDKGIALGMVRNNGYAKFIEANNFTYQPGDVMILYTDGITEAKNNRGEEFGYERLTEAIREVKDEPARKIQEHLINQLYAFTGTENINDDYTTMVVRFK
jgi:serine phosphatase RsbU (regulator of sigma subunit)